MKSNSGFDLVVVMPLYGFKTDKERIPLSGGFRIEKYDFDQIDRMLAEPGDSSFRSFLTLFPPDFLVWVENQVHKSTGVTENGIEDPSESLGRLMVQRFGQAIDAAENLLISLRLFRPGRLERGPLGILMSRVGREGRTYIEAQVEGTRPLSWMAVEGLPGRSQRADQLELKEELVPSFEKFRHKLGRFLQDQKLRKSFAVPLSYFNKSHSNDWAAGQLLDLVVSLESILLQEQDELTFRLALRVANLLGRDEERRKQIYREIKGFYDVRSQVIHGDVLKDKQELLLNEVGKLREYVRQLLLAMISLALKKKFDSDFYRSLDEMCLDDATRKKIQADASGLLHIDPAN